MTIAIANSVSLLGLNGQIVKVEAEVGSGLPSFSLVGLPDASLSEAKDRVKTAISNSGLEWPLRKVLINLAPASTKKHGSSFDLAIAVSVLASSGQIRQLDPYSIFLGELSLTGSVNRVSAVLPSLLAAKKLAITRAFVPEENFAEAKLVSDLEVIPIKNLLQIAAMLGAKNVSVPNYEPPLEQQVTKTSPSVLAPDMADVQGNSLAIWACTVAAAGGHHLLLVGPPGVGKTLIASRIPTILPPLTHDELLESIAIRSLAAKTLTAQWGRDLADLSRAFEAPHHSASAAALIGGGMANPVPGAISLAHNGVLFLDEAPEFAQNVLESLRQPLESGEVSIRRSNGSAIFPAKFQLVLAANPCPCGFALGGSQKCSCSASARTRYQAKLSGPLLDRVDIRFVMAQSSKTATEPAASSREIRERVIAARKISANRLAKYGLSLNSQIPPKLLRTNFRLDNQVAQKLNFALQRGTISQRGFDRCLRLAWTIADLNNHEQPTKDDLDGALLLRGSDQPLGVGR